MKREQEEKIKDLEHRVARLQKELEESSNGSRHYEPDRTKPQGRVAPPADMNNSRREAPRVADRPFTGAKLL